MLLLNMDINNTCFIFKNYIVNVKIDLGMSAYVMQIYDQAVAELFKDDIK